MKPLIILLGVFAVSLLAIKIITGNYDFALSGCIAMSVMLVFTGAAHFFYTKGMAMMLPGFVPFKIPIIYVTGIIEIAAAIGLLIPHFQILTAWALIIFYVLILPANIYAAIKRIDYQKGTFDGSGLQYLWFRVPLQILFIGWVYVFAIMYE